MEVKIIDSKGRCYLLTDKKGNALMLEAGADFEHVRQAADIRQIRGCLISNSAQAKYVADVFNNKIDVYCTPGTAVNFRTSQYQPERLEYRENRQIGGFAVSPFQINDLDCGWLIYHPEMGMMLYAADAGRLLLQTNGIATFLIECNYVDAKLNDAEARRGITKIDAENVRRSHLSLAQTTVFLNHNIDIQTRKVILCNLSEKYSDERLMVDVIKTEIAKDVCIAKTGKTIKI